MRPSTLYKVMSVGGALGLVSAFLQTLEKLILLENKDAVLPCNFNSVFNCSQVLNAWQSSVFGFPNSIMCLVLFTTFTVIGLAGAMGGQLTRNLRLGIQGLSLFTLGFALWFLWQSTYSIGALCIFCLICFTGLLMINWAWLRLNASDLPSEKLRGKVNKLIESNVDIAIWAGLGALVALAMLIRFSL